MKKFNFQLIAFLTVFNSFSFSQTTFNWNSYVAGSMSYSTSVGTCTMNATVSGSNFNNASVPAYGTTYGTGLFIDHNWLNQSSVTTITLNFSSPLTNPSFQINESKTCFFSVNSQPPSVA